MSGTKKGNKTKKKVDAEDGSSIKDMLLEFAGSFVRNFFDKLQEGISGKIREVLHEVKRTVTVTFLLLLGIIFMLIGLANVVDILVGMKGIGYLFIGFVIMFFGIFLNIMTKRS